MSNTFTARQKRTLINSILKARIAREFVAALDDATDFHQCQRHACFIAKMVEARTGLSAGGEYDFVVYDNEIRVMGDNGSCLNLCLPDWAVKISNSRPVWNSTLTDLKHHFHTDEYRGERTLHMIFPQG